MQKLPTSPQFIGTASWNLPPQVKSEFPEEGTHLERYSQRFSGVEINSSFYREHQPATYAKWAAATPDDFRFSVKLSRYFTQDARLVETGPRLQKIIRDISELGDKWDVLLVQLPPSLKFEANVARRFLDGLRVFYSGAIAWEPRHPTWSDAGALDLLADYEISKVLADPEPCPVSETQEVYEKFRYYRLHGSPEIYKSNYSGEALAQLAEKIKDSPAARSRTWCIFDNTTYGFATENALELQRMIASKKIQIQPGTRSEIP